jgi:hypothetical protein
VPLQIKNASVCAVVALRITEKPEQRVRIKFRQNVGKTCTGLYDMIKMAFGEHSMSRTQVIEWFRSFEGGRTSVDSDAKFEARPNGCSEFSSI